MKAAWRRMAVLLMAVTATQAGAGDMYQWRDEKGRMHVSDQVPEAFRDRAVKMNSSRYELTPSKQAEAQARTKQERAVRRISRERKLAEEEAARLAQQEAESKRAAEQAIAAASAAASAAKAKKKGDDPKAACPELRRQYEESMACFGPYRMGPRIRPEAFQHCVDRPDPSKLCGPKSYP